MGNFEKLSVLVIVVIIVMILVVALYTWTDKPDEGTTTSNNEEVGTTDPSFVPAQRNAGSDVGWPTEWDDEEEGDGEGEGAVVETPPVAAPSAPAAPTAPVPPPPTVPVDVPPSPVVPGDPVPGVDASITPPPSMDRGMGSMMSGSRRPAAHQPQGSDSEPWIYTVKSGDTISQVCERELGTWRRQKEVFALNPRLDPLSIRAGDKLKMPPRGRASSVRVSPGAAAPAAPAPGAAARVPARASGAVPTGSWYVVRRGDRMENIAKRAYGNIDRWPELWARNLSVVKDPDDILAGTRIFIPK